MTDIYCQVCQKLQSTTGRKIPHDDEWCDCGGVPGLKRRLEDLQHKYYDFTQAVERGGLDISPCIFCGKSVICIPDGLPACEKCAEENQ